MLPLALAISAFKLILFARPTSISAVRIVDPCLNVSVELLAFLITWNASWLFIQLLDARFHDAFTAERAWY